MGNTVGSLDLPTILRVRKNMTLEVSDFQRDVLVGSVLGDAYITKLGKFKFEQSLKQSEYVFWKYEALKSILYDSEPKIMVRWHSRNNKFYSSLRFSSRQYFKSWRDALYPIGIKVFPKNLILSPASLAVWYMDDGCWTGSKVVIAIEGFDDESHQNMQNALLEHFDIKTLIGKNRKLLIRKESHIRFFDLISDFVIPSMRYKIPNPVTTGNRFAPVEDGEFSP